MKNSIDKNKKFCLKGLFLLSLFALILFGCVFIDSISIMQLQEDGSEAPIAKAGTEATFTIQGNINCAEDHPNVRFVTAILVPKSWNVRERAQVTYVTTLGSDPGAVLTMSAIPETSLPKNAGGRTWSDALMYEYGVGPNVLSDMEWVAFQTDDEWAIFNGEKPTYTISIRTDVGELNMRTYLGFFVNHTDDGISTSADHKKVVFSTDAFEVVDGKGLTIDFCTDHFNKVQPLATLQDDFVTFSFNSIIENELASSGEIYIEAKAYDASGALITAITERSNKTLLVRESAYSNVYGLTIWPADYFNIPDGVVLNRIEYIFTNREGSVTITQSDDDYITKDIEIVGEKKPFVFELLCE